MNSLETDKDCLESKFKDATYILGPSVVITFWPFIVGFYPFLSDFSVAVVLICGMFVGNRLKSHFVRNGGSWY